MITGDIVYGKGLISEYRTKYWPIYNSDEASPSSGAPLLRSTLFIAAPGNHDIASRDLGKDAGRPRLFLLLAPAAERPDRQSRRADHRSAARTRGEPESVHRCRRQPPFPEWPISHSTMATPTGRYSTRTPPSTGPTASSRNGSQNDLAAAKGATWRFVSFHQPGFNSSKTHFGEQYMRVLAPIFEDGKVDVVFNGHVHNYQRSYPLRFVPAAEKDAAPCQRRGRQNIQGTPCRRQVHARQVVRRPERHHAQTA